MSDHDKQNGSNEDTQELSVPAPSRPDAGTLHDSGGSPQRPSYSPVTPTLSQASLVSQDGTGVNLPPPQWMDEPPEPLPLSLDDNPDAIALRATLSILQIQRQQALRDMRELDKIKKTALENPEHFVSDLQAGKMSRPPRTGVEVDEVEAPTPEENGTSKFGQLPAAQNVVRSPPIEWGKYHIVGEPLERIHQLQQQYPGAPEQALDGQDRPQLHTIAAPYRPFADRLEDTKPSSNARSSEF